MRSRLQETPASQVSSHSEVIGALRPGTVLLVPSQRVARHCLQQFDMERQGNSSTSAWQAPHILAWNAWVVSLWRDAMVCGVESRVLLNSLQERALWAQALGSETASGTPLNAAQLRLCASAVRLLGAYDVHGEFHKRQASGTDEQTFATWYNRLEELCVTNRFLPAAFSEIKLARHVLDGHLTPAAEYILFGFNTLTTAQEHFLSALRSTGAHIRHVRFHRPQQQPPRIVRCASNRDAMDACAIWARQSLLANPAATLAIVVPYLEECRTGLERELRAAIAPESSDVTFGELQPRYEFSSGRPLNRIPMVADALCLLRWCTDDLTLQQIGTLLRSPHLTLAPTPERGAELDAFVLPKIKALRAELSLRSVTAVLRKHDAPTAKRLGAFAWASRSVVRSAQTFAEFTDNVRDLLRLAGWPGTGSLTSEEYQAIDRWNDALDRLATLDLFGSKSTFDEALADLNFVAAEMLFLPENTGAPVQIIAMNEAAGVSADALWFLHADEDTLSTRRATHPLLPLALQRDLNMPGTNASNDEHAVMLAVQCLAASFGHATFSYASLAGETPQRLAPLLTRLASTWDADFLVHETAPVIQPAPLLESVEDSVPLPALPPGTVHGGVSIITAQSQCAFRAFAEHRLFASAPEQVQAGYSPGDRGEHVHTVLSAFWRVVRDHATLVEWTNTTGPDGSSRRDALLDSLIGEIYKTSRDAWNAAYIRLQHKRLLRLLSAWLDDEAKRKQFTVIATEQEVSATLGPLQLNMRVDRIDASETGAKLLIDYKTGPAEPREWLDERPDAPQLPVYAVAAGLEDVQGIAFAKVLTRKDKRCLSGRGAPGNEFKLTALKKDFQEQLETWFYDLERLATSFADGDTAVDPKVYPTTCERCQQRMLCRVESMDRTELDDEIDEDSEVLEWQ